MDTTPANATPTNERKLILEMVADGKITVDDAQRLFDKLQDAERRQQATGEADAATRPRPKHLRIVTTGDDSDDEINLRIPLGLVRAGLALDSFLPSWAQSRVIVGSKLSDLTDLDTDYLRENLDELDMTFGSEDGESVRIFAE